MADLDYLKKLTEELAKEVDGNLYGGPLFGLMCDYFNTINSYISIVKSDGKILFLNNALIKRMKDLGYSDIKKYIGKTCVEIDSSKSFHLDAIKECAETAKVVVRRDIISKYSNETYDLVCLPLKYNGVLAIVEMWTKIVIT